MQPLFASNYLVEEEKFEFEYDEHWNEHGHQLVRHCWLKGKGPLENWRELRPGGLDGVGDDGHSFRSIEQCLFHRDRDQNIQR